MQAQQRKLNAFVKEHNDVRPHEAWNMRTPSAVHILSERKYPEAIKEWGYPSNVYVRYVSRNGAFRIGRTNWLFITTALAGKEIGLKINISKRIS
jgi:hypothetical protein